MCCVYLFALENIGIWKEHEAQAFQDTDFTVLTGSCNSSSVKTSRCSSGALFRPGMVNAELKTTVQI
jgi:hypothetical protein